MKIFKLGLPALIVGAGLTMYLTPSYGTVEFAKKEKTKCATCHATATPKKGASEVNPVGACYKKSKDLAACKK